MSAVWGIESATQQGSDHPFYISRSPRWRQRETSCPIQRGLATRGVGQQSERPPGVVRASSTGQGGLRVHVPSVHAQRHMHRGDPVICARPPQNPAHRHPLTRPNPNSRQKREAHPRSRKGSDGHRQPPGHPSRKGDGSRNRRPHQPGRGGSQIHAPMASPIGRGEPTKDPSRCGRGQDDLTRRSSPRFGGKRRPQRQDEERPPPHRTERPFSHL